MVLGFDEFWGNDFLYVSISTVEKNQKKSKHFENKCEIIRWVNFVQNLHFKPHWEIEKYFLLINNFKGYKLISELPKATSKLCNNKYPIVSEVQLFRTFEEYDVIGKWPIEL